MSSAKDDEGQEVEIDWNDPFQRVKFFYEYCSPDGEKVRTFPHPHAHIPTTYCALVR